MFYAYIWLRQDGTPYYVGKGKGDRAFEQTGHRVRRPQDSDSIIVQEYETEDDAFEAERFFISLYGRADLKTGCLRNLTDGGEGVSGAVRTEGWKRNIGLGNKGRKPVGYTRTKEHRRQLQERMKGNKVGDTRAAQQWALRQTSEYRKERARKAAQARWGRVDIR